MHGRIDVWFRAVRTARTATPGDPDVLYFAHLLLGRGRVPVEGDARAAVHHAVHHHVGARGILAQRRNEVAAGQVAVAHAVVLAVPGLLLVAFDFLDV